MLKFAIVVLAAIVLCWVVAVSLSVKGNFSWRLLFISFCAKRRMERIISHRSPTARIFSRQGSTRTNARLLAYWVATNTDEERDLWRRDQSLVEDLRRVLFHCGYPSEAVPFVSFVFESQETVDRDYGGSWPEAMEMP